MPNPCNEIHDVARSFAKVAMVYRESGLNWNFSLHNKPAIAYNNDTRLRTLIHNPVCCSTSTIDMACQHLEPSRRFYTPYYSERSTAMGIRLHVTDAQSILPPKGAMRHINNIGSVDYYEESNEEEVNLWLRKIGRYAACHALHRSEVTWFRHY
jgi:hypothetical protein